MTTPQVEKPPRVGWSEKTTRRVFRNVSTLVLAAALLYILLSQVQVEDVWHTLLSISPKWLGLAFVLYTINYLLRAVRFSRLVKSRSVALRPMFRIVCFHNLFNYLLPARTGEFTYVYFLRRGENVTIPEGLSTLFVARVFDLLAGVTLFLVVILLSYRTLPTLLIWFALLALGAGIVTLFLATRLRAVIQSASWLVSPRLARRAGGMKPKRVDWILSRIDAVARQLALIGNRRVFVETYSLSLVLWFSIYAFYYLLIQGFGAHLSVTETVVASTVGILAILLPIHSFGGFGTTEASWTVALMLVGLGKETAISVGFGTHVVVLLCAVVLGALGMIMARNAKLPAIRGGSS